MRFGKSLRGVLAGALVLWGASGAVAQDRPDIDDSDQEFFGNTLVNEEGNNEFNSNGLDIGFFSSGDGNLSGSQSQTVSTPAFQSYAFLFAYLYEPDLIDREPDAQKLRQNNFASVFLSGSTAAGAFDSGSATRASGCKIKVKGLGDGDFDAMNATSQCNQGALDGLIGVPAVKSLIQDLIGTKSDGTGVKAVAKGVPN